MPDTGGVIPKVSDPVPPDAANAVDDSGREKVVWISEPLVRDSAPLTVMLSMTLAVDPASSVAVMVS